MPLDDQKLGTPTANPTREQDMAPDCSMPSKRHEPVAGAESARTGASLAYCSIFSTGPLIVVVISIAALVFQREGVQQQVVELDQGRDRPPGCRSGRRDARRCRFCKPGVFATIIGTAALLSARHWRRAVKEASNTVSASLSSMCAAAFAKLKFRTRSCASISKNSDIYCIRAWSRHQKHVEL